jgi:hypothetical protein
MLPLNPEEQAVLESVENDEWNSVPDRSREMQRYQSYAQVQSQSSFQERETAMLKSYEAIYENGQVKWLGEQPSVESARLIVTVLDVTVMEEKTLPVKRRIFPTDMAGKVEILGDIVSPIVDEEDWECLK